MTKGISNGEDVLDTRDIEAYIDELEGSTVACGDCDGNGNKLDDARNVTDDECSVCKGEGEVIALDEVEKQELAVLKALRDEFSGDWGGGTTLVRESYFEDYAREFAQDLHGSSMREVHWPFSCIDWKEAAEELMQDYSSIEWDGVTYYYRE